MKDNGRFLHNIISKQKLAVESAGLMVRTIPKMSSPTTYTRMENENIRPKQ